MIDVNEFTNLLLDEFGRLIDPVPVGDGVAPLEAGWVEGTPNSPSGFVEYLVLRCSGQITPTYNSVPLCSNVPTMLTFPYSLTAFANSRVAADDLAGLSREVMVDMPVREMAGDLEFKASHVQLVSITGASRDDSTNPKMWSATTNFRIDVARIAT